MTIIDGKCDGKNCDHEFEDGEEYIQLISEYDDNRIYCTRECALTGMPELFTYYTFNARKCCKCGTDTAKCPFPTDGEFAAQLNKDPYWHYQKPCWTPI